MMQNILETKLNHLDRLTNAYTHFCKLENMVKNLYQSGFKLTKESFLGMLYHLSLPNLEGFPFVNVARQLDLRMAKDDTKVSNNELVLLTHNELILFQQQGHNNTAAKQGNNRGGTSSKQPNSTPNVKWCR